MVQSYAQLAPTVDLVLIFFIVAYILLLAKLATSINYILTRRTHPITPHTTCTNTPTVDLIYIFSLYCIFIDIFFMQPMK